MKEQIREDMLDEVVDQYLTESDTIWLLDMPAVSVSVDSEEAEAVRLAFTQLAELSNVSHWQTLVFACCH